MGRVKRKTKGIILVILVAALLLGVYYYYITPVEGQYVDGNEFGEWGQQFIVDYADGSHVNLNVVDREQRLSVTHQGIPIVSLTYKLSARASGTGYTSIGIDYSAFTVTYTAGTNVVNRNWVGQPLASIPLDSPTWHEICTNTVSDTTLQGSLSPNTYQMTIAGGGTLLYKGNTDTEWMPATIPGQITFEITVTVDYALIIEFSNAISYSSGVQQQPEDFTTYTESDSNYYTVSSSNILITSQPRTSLSYVRKPKALGTAAFSFTFTLIMTQMDPNVAVGGTGGTINVLLPNKATTTTVYGATAAADGLEFSARQYNDAGTQRILMRLKSKTAGGGTFEYGSAAQTQFVTGTTYTIIISRTLAGSASLTVKNGATVVCSGTLYDATDIQYVVATCGSNAAGTQASSGTISSMVFSLE
jgi:hypothetical protein